MPSFIPAHLKEPPGSAPARSRDPATSGVRPQPVLELQRAIGNQAVAGLLQAGDPAAKQAAVGGVRLSSGKEGGREEAAGEPDRLSQILPKDVGPLVRMMTVLKVHEIFSAELLDEHVRLVHGDPAATALVQANGVAGLVALYDTRRDGTIDVAAAERALREYPERYSAKALEKLRITVRREAARTYWFEDPAMQRPPEQKQEELPRSGQEERQKVFTEPDLQSAHADSTVVRVRFSYPDPDIGQKKVTTAKNQILTALSVVLGKILELRQEGPEKAETGARLKEAFSGFDAKTPLNIYIATSPKQEFESSQVAATTERIFVRLEDVGNPKKLQAAIRIPLIMLRGGMLPGAGEVHAASPAELQDTLLHEALHVMLIKQSSDSETIWALNQQKLRVGGNPSAKSRFMELAHRYVLAQEELFAYENAGSLGNTTERAKVDNEQFIARVGPYLVKRGLALNPVVRRLSVRQPVRKKSVPWSISYQVPAGDVQLTVSDIVMVEALLETFPLR